MKRLAILAVGLLFVGGLYACGDGETKPGAEVIIPNNDNGGGPTTDPGGTDETPRPDIDEPDNDPGTPDQDPGTGETPILLLMFQTTIQGRLMMVAGYLAV